MAAPAHAMRSPYDIARELIDASHRRDPLYIAKNQGTGSHPHALRPTHDAGAGAALDELAYADCVESWALKLLPAYADSLPEPARENEELVRLAARCQHLERFLHPRSSYPEGKAGYLKWRRDLYTIQADRAAELLKQAGVPEDEIEAARTWISKTDLKPGKATGNQGTQLLEDAAVLVFLEQELALFAQRHSSDYSREKFVDILKKTWRKLSPHAKEAAKKLEIDESLSPILADAIAEAEKSAAAAAAASTSDDAQSTEQSISDALRATSLSLNQASEPSAPKTTSSVQAVGASSANKASESEISAPARPKTLEEAKRLREADSEKAAATFGARLLEDQEGESVWEHNAWDHVEPPADYLETIRGLLDKQAETAVPPEEAAKYHGDAASFWDNFYSKHENRFFKDRRWLHLEFPELTAAIREDAPAMRIIEVGCGAGNTVFPLLEANKNPRLELFACDYSAEAVQVVRNEALYSDPNKIGSCSASVWDLSATSPPQEGEEPQAKLPDGIEPHSVDIVVLIFVLSALRPEEWAAAARNVKAMLKPGGMVLFRDYGRYDLPQLRFKKDRLLEDNFYVRGDGTRVYFFLPEQLLQIFNASPPPSGAANQDEDDGSGGEQAEAIPSRDVEGDAGKDYATVQLAVDRRLLVNRREQKRMYRNWVQAKLRRL
ncbi:hypothetical protein OC842_005076 [Tilletia horrida]|uniref:Methyltransferase type 12 domain-containing protein n=1 Tax=Tilletia horrida TaxID=155126 RepID=A0AAN6G8I6_9BASI|nr:hypothetical protein OC842_005076 [Tilletia horrida]